MHRSVEVKTTEPAFRNASRYTLGRFCKYDLQKRKLAHICEYPTAGPDTNRRLVVEYNYAPYLDWCCVALQATHTNTFFVD